MISLSSVSALDSNGTNIGSGDDVIGVSDVNSESDLIGDVESDDDELLSVSDFSKLKANNNGTFTDLNNTIKNSKDGNISLDRNYVYNNKSDNAFIEGINVTKDLTINGNGFTISGNYLSRIFYVENGVTLTLSNLTLTKGNADYGGAIYNNNSTLIIKNTKINNNNANEYYGGAIYNNLGTVTINNTNLTKNTATMWGGAIYNVNSTLTITNTTINNNTADYYGGTIYNYESNLTITNTTITNNNATYGGAIRNCRSNLTITNTTITNNNATYGSGGAINNEKSNLTITNTKITNNTAERNGGAINNDQSNLNITNTNITNNTVKYKGGAIYNIKSNNTITNTKITNNTANTGGAIENYHSNLTITNTTITNNTATNYGGAICNNYYSNLTITNTTITNNTANTGGAIHNNNANATIINSSFGNNSANTETINNNYSTINFENNTFNNDLVGRHITYSWEELNFKISEFFNETYYDKSIQECQYGVYVDGELKYILNYEDICSITVYQSSVISVRVNITIKTDMTLESVEKAKILDNLSLSGNLTNNFSGAIPNATVKIVNLNTGDEYTAQTDENGSYNLIIPVDLEMEDDTDYLNIKVIFEGYEKYESSEADIIVLVEKRDTETSMEVVDIYVNEETVLNATVSSDMNVTNGTIEFYIESELIGSVQVDEIGTGKLKWDCDLEAGNYLLKAVYKGTNEYKQSEAYTILTVKPKDTTIEIISPNTITKNNTGIIEARVYANNSQITEGEVELYLNNELYARVNITNGTVAINIFFSQVGNNTVTVKYIGNKKYAESQNSTSIIVKTEIDLIIKINNTSYGKSVKGILKLLDQDANEINGTVILTVGNSSYLIAILNGTGTFISPNLPAGNYRVDARLIETVNYNATNKSVSFKIAKANQTEMNIYSQNTNGTINTIITLPEDAEGKITYVLTDEKGSIIANKTAEISNGTAKISVDDLEDGNYTITVSYSGDNNYKSTALNSTVEVINRVKEAKLNIRCDNITYGNNATIKIDLADSENNPLSGVVVVSVNGTDYNVTVTNGSGSLTVSNIRGGLHKVVANFTSEKYGENIAITNISVEKLNTTLIFKNMTTNVVLNGARTGEYFNVTLTDINGKALANKTVYIGFNGKVYKRTTNSTGGVQLQINIGYQSANTFSITFLGDENYSGNVSCAIIVVNTVKTTLKVTKTTYTYKSSAKTKTVKATLKLTNGTVISGQTISIKINGAIYQAKTNSKGVATIKVPITTKGTYSAKVTFDGNNQYTRSTGSVKVKIS